MRKREVLKELKPLLPHPVDTKLVLVTCKKEAHIRSFISCNFVKLRRVKLIAINSVKIIGTWLVLIGLLCNDWKLQRLVGEREAIVEAQE